MMRRTRRVGDESAESGNAIGTVYRTGESHYWSDAIERNRVEIFQSGPRAGAGPGPGASRVVRRPVPAAGAALIYDRLRARVV